MRTIRNVAVAAALTGTALLSSANPGNANTIAGAGYSSSYAGESVFTSVPPGQTGQFSAIFFNDGTQTWTPGVVGLLVCAQDKTTCNVPQNLTYAKNWYSQSVYATATSAVAPGQNGFFIYNFSVPFDAAPGTTTTFYGDLGLIADGSEIHPEGYFQANTTPALTLTVSPSPASVQVGSTLQFSVTAQATGATVTWSVTGGCGAITSAGLFAATSMNSVTQPCTVVAAASGGTGIAPVNVFGQATQLSCSVSPNPISANGGTTGGVATAKIALKDANGNVVTNASLPVVTVNNVTPALATMTPIGAVTPVSGVISVKIATTTAPGDIQVSASAFGVTGCNAIVTSSGAGPATATLATFLTNPIASDGVSTSTLQVDITDARGNRVTSDSTTQLTATMTSGAGICTFVGGAGTFIATASQGRATFAVQSTTAPGQCGFTIMTNNSSIAGTSASLTTQIVGAANRISVLSNDSPHSVGDPSNTCTAAGPNTDVSCTLIVVAVQDANGSLITGDNGRAITAIPAPGACTGAGGGDVAVRPPPTTTSAGKATFAISSRGAYYGCTITFAATGLSSINTTAVWNPGGAYNLGCVFNPSSIFADGSSQSSGLVTVRDTFGNVVTAGTYSVQFSRTAGNVTVMLTGTPQSTGAGLAAFQVRSTTTAGTGTDTYLPALYNPPPGGGLPGAPTSCNIVVHL